MNQTSPGGFFRFQESTQGHLISCKLQCGSLYDSALRPPGRPHPIGFPLDCRYIFKCGLLNMADPAVKVSKRVAAGRHSFKKLLHGLFIAGYPQGFVKLADQALLP